MVEMYLICGLLLGIVFVVSWNVLSERKKIVAARKKKKRHLKVVK